MNRPRSPVRSKLFPNANNINSSLYLAENKIMETTEGRKNHVLMVLDQNSRFSISKIQKNNNFQHFIITVNNMVAEVKTKIDSIDDFDFFIKYLGKFGYGYGLQSIASEFVKAGKGNFASVYRFVSSFRTTKAMKMFEKKRLENPKNKLSFLNEVKMMRTLKSPNLASLDCIFQTDKSFYLQMEYFQETLKSYLKNPISKNKQKSIMKNLINGLKQMKQKNIIHRDIKPDNIMVRKKQGQTEEQFVIIDFGLSAEVSEQESIHKKCGTPGFIAPQIANMGQKSRHISFQCDVFSLGVTFFYMYLFNKHRLTKNKPFSGADNKEVLLKNKKMVIQEYLFYYMSEAESDLVKKMMQKEPQRRITIQQALKHRYFQDQVDDNDLISQQKCDLCSKLKQIKIMDTSFISEGVVLLYSLLKFSHYKTQIKQQFTNCIVDTEFNELQSKQYSHQFKLDETVIDKG